MAANGLPLHGQGARQLTRVCVCVLSLYVNCCADYVLMCGDDDTVLPVIKGLYSLLRLNNIISVKLDVTLKV